ncbi:recombination protein RecR [Fulvitalea axinellae]|uniref:Recombination protein RecR n=1 Tax=Fulvitalea axinellae TaxID=1182444 RepID=A0AAU9CJD2_9BACT|nr:recombination protein RecR [Fulvitalea axinellae]
MQFPSKLIENAVLEMAKLPGIGKKTALRLVLNILKRDSKETESLAEALVKVRNEIRYCDECHNISDEPVCTICSSSKRETGIICVVEDAPDVLAIENTGQYLGRYHVLGGVIAPIEGIGPGELNIDSLIRRIEKSEGEIREVILALSPTMEGDTTGFYVTKKLKEYDIKVSVIARGVPIGGELEYTDEVTLGRSILGRRSYETSF